MDLHRHIDDTVSNRTAIQTMTAVRSELKNVPVVDVHRNNLTQIWPSMLHAVNSALYIAIDIELSGLGNRKSLMTKIIEDRFTEICKGAETRSVLSLGLSCFKLDPNKDETNEHAHTQYNVQTFNMTVLCSDDYVVEPSSLEFLVEHGFDFNKQYSIGIPYFPGNDRELGSDGVPGVRLLFLELVKSRKPLVIHNGLVDLVFLYHHFYAKLPTKLSVFVADLCEMFPGGIYDTKYLSEFAMRHPASYLEYVFRKLQQLNESQQNELRTVSIRFPDYGHVSDCVEYRDLSTSQVDGLTKCNICTRYANHGWCPRRMNCSLSHDVSAIIQLEQLSSKTARRKAKTRKMSDRSEAVDCVEIENTTDQCCDGKNRAGNTHRAGYDAFMTGFAMAVFIKTLKTTDLTSDDSPTKKFADRICLSGKDHPLLIQKSSFATTSKQHRTKLVV